QSPFTALNTAFFQDGGFVFVPPGQKVEMPIHLLFLSTVNENGATSSPRNLIVIGENSELTILESYASAVEVPSLTNTVTELVLGEGAKVEHCKFQNQSLSTFHIAALHAHLGARSNLISHSIVTGAKLARNNIRTTLAGEGAECILNGLYLTRDDQ